MTHQCSRSTFVALWAGMALTVLALLSAQFGRPLIGDHIHGGYPSISPNEITAGVDFYVISLTIIGVLGLLCWAVTIRSAHRGGRWVRWLAATFALIGTSVAAFALLVRDTSGDTGLPPLIGTIGLLPCAAGLVAVVLMFTRSATSANRNSAAPHRSSQAGKD